MGEAVHHEGITDGSDFLESKLQDMELLVKEMDMQIQTRLKESERKLAEIARQIDLYEWDMAHIPSTDLATVNSRRSQLFSAINSLRREYRSERIQAWKDVSALRLERQKLAVEIEDRRRLLAV